MAHHALQQCLFQVKWGDLDYLFMDLPPGTGDVHLTLVQSVSITGAVMVSTPQDVGLTISMKTYRMFETTNVRTLGIIENMSYHLCPHCGQREEIFGNGGVADAAKRLNIPFLGEIPLDTRIREQADKGIPIVAADPASPLSGAYRNIAEQLAAQISIASYGSSDGKEHKEGPQKLKPRDIQKVGEDMMKITWNDGHESKLSAYHLRENCRCATCRNEHTGEKILPPGSVPRDIKILKQEVIGNYALAFIFSDGHSTGIYSYQYLRDTCPCCVEAHAA
jgi:ATP-binding protein involved in chromosome partitioning